MITSIPACYRRCNNDAAQRGKLSESQQLVPKYNEPFLRLLTEDDNNNHAVHQTCSTVDTVHFSDLLSMWFSWWQCGHLFCSVFWMSGWGRTYNSQWDESHKKTAFADTAVKLFRYWLDKSEGIATVPSSVSDVCYNHSNLSAVRLNSIVRVVVVGIWGRKVQ